MAQPLRVLIVEDWEGDAILLIRELRRGGYELTTLRVETAEAMRAALTAGVFDLIVSDYSLPRFNALQALAIVKELNVDIPFIINSGTVGEETAVEAMRAGAHDFLVKGQYARLMPAIERELREASFRRERREMREQLHLAERMASIGTLAAGVAHEINNPLASLVVNLELALEDLGELGGEEPSELTAVRFDSVQQQLRDASDAAERIRLIVRDLKVFSRGDELRTGPVDVRNVLSSALRMASNEIRHRARIVTDFADVHDVEANDARLGQVFLNLLVNAAQALPEGSADKNEIRVVVLQSGPDEVVVEVHDTGAGIPPQIVSRIFDPFFTTKPIGVGTGLGLSICHRIVVGFHGQIAVESEVGKGTVVRVTLPVAKGVTAAVPTIPVTGPSGRRCRILFVDDEPVLGPLVKRALAPAHEVVYAGSGKEALAAITRGDAFDLILCDLMMPQMSGMDFHEELMQTDPAQAAKMVFMTGGAFTTRAREFLERVSNPRLDKPFKRDQLRSFIDGLLG